MARAEFPQAKLLVRSFDRGARAASSSAAGVDYQIRETFESALRFGGATLRGLGVSEAETASIAEEVRAMDAERFAQQLAAGTFRAGQGLMRTNAPKPAPLVTPPREGRDLNSPGPVDCQRSPSRAPLRRFQEAY